MLRYRWEFKVRPSDAPWGQVDNKCKIFDRGKVIAVAEDSDAAQLIVDALNIKEQV
ncbi:hypothetical protein EVB71_082 [Rhizobium phage RHph_Y55]|nr:hypothetical protein EVB71_082 [Rhizobium phage RHph_Y55]